MPIENRDLQAGMVLTARHKGKEHECEIVQTEDGLRYRLRDGSEYRSPSSAGRAITDGVAVNGWRFWSLAGDLKPARTKTARPVKKASTKKAPAKKGGKKTTKGKSKPKAKASSAKNAASYGCGICGEEFATMKTATKHAMTHTA